MKVKTKVKAGVFTSAGGGQGQCLLPVGCHPPIMPIGGNTVT